MVACIITGHGDFASGMLSAFNMIAGEQENVTCVVFHEENAQTFGETLSTKIHDMQKTYGEVCVFCDLLGGTPFNQAMLTAAQMEHVEVVAGVSLPVLLECISSISADTTAQELAETAAEVGKMSCVHMSVPAGNSCACEANDVNDTEEDGI